MEDCDFAAERIAWLKRRQIALHGYVEIDRSTRYEDSQQLAGEQLRQTADTINGVWGGWRLSGRIDAPCSARPNQAAAIDDTHHDRRNLSRALLVLDGDQRRRPDFGPSHGIVALR